MSIGVYVAGEGIHALVGVLSGRVLGKNIGSCFGLKFVGSIWFGERKI